MYKKTITRIKFKKHYTCNHSNGFKIIEFGICSFTNILAQFQLNSSVK